MFIGRTAELQFLESRYHADGGQLIVLYGRRHVGKTETLKQFCQKKPHVFFTCRECTDRLQLRNFSEKMLKKTSRRKNMSVSFLIGSRLSGLYWSSPTVRRKNCLSSMNFRIIERELLAEKNPLYGRATGIYKMREMRFYDTVKFFPDYSDRDKILAYSVLGEIPHYLNQFDPKLSLSDNIKQNILTKGCTLYSEIDFLLRQELRETPIYSFLIELGIIKREFSVDVGTREKANTNRGIYKLTDQFFRFWYAFPFTHYSDLEAGDVDGVYNYEIEPLLHEYASAAFEDVCRQFVQAQQKKNALPFRYAKMGRWIGKTTVRDTKGPNGTRLTNPQAAGRRTYGISYISAWWLLYNQASKGG